MANRNAVGQPAPAESDGHYGDDLAYIHDAGFGEVARGAAELLVTRLHSNRIRAGLVTDLGCGSGILAAALTEAGYDVLGVDLSESMLALAAARAPRASFTRASLFSVDNSGLRRRDRRRGVFQLRLLRRGIARRARPGLRQSGALPAVARVSSCSTSPGPDEAALISHGKPPGSARTGRSSLGRARTRPASGSSATSPPSGRLAKAIGVARSATRCGCTGPTDIRAELTRAGLRAEPLAGYGPGALLLRVARLSCGASIGDLSGMPVVRSQPGVSSCQRL